MEEGAVSDLCRKAAVPLRLEGVQDSWCCRWDCAAINLLLGNTPLQVHRLWTRTDCRAFPASPIPLAAVGLRKMSLGWMHCDFWEGTLGLEVAFLSGEAGVLAVTITYPVNT